MSASDKRLEYGEAMSLPQDAVESAGHYLIRLAKLQGYFYDSQVHPRSGEDDHALSCAMGGETRCNLAHCIEEAIDQMIQGGLLAVAIPEENCDDEDNFRYTLTLQCDEWLKSGNQFFRGS